ncbi:MAG: AsmA-like C-terminal region-containing protein, partial [Gammaproteobacteria bacterium]|nr:AsmA-like C-terminal region-containing protein [Gammaproteobacteria bacterium]
LNFSNGEIDYLAEISIPNASQAGTGNDSNRIRLSSELLGLSLDLPPPFSKTVENIRPLEVLIEFTENNEWVSVRFDNRVGANIRITENEFSGGKVVFGMQAREMRFGDVPLVEPGLVINGFLDRFDYDDWENAALHFSEMSVTPDNEQSSLSDYISLVDVDAGQLLVVGQELENVHVQVSRSGGVEEDSESGIGEANNSWSVILENELLGGTFIFPDDEQSPWNVDLDYLRFPADEDEEAEPEPEEEIDMLADINPATLPDLDFRTREFSLGDKHFGIWEFVLRTHGDSATISELTMTAADALIRDFSGETGANLDWRYDNGVHTSSFNGLFSAGDMAQVLPGWGYDANVESESAAFVSNLQWSGSPAAFELGKVIGDVQVNILNGRFVDIDSGGSRLFGAFSFDSLVRRLQLDFSDLYEKGLAYDAIGGSLYFDRGIVATQGPFEITGPSSKITIDGNLNLINETIDADMLVNVPFSQNLSVLAGILGAWPIALSAFLASRIFEDQMDDFTTVLYRLEGPWENPVSGFEPAAEILESDRPDAEPAGNNAL